MMVALRSFFRWAILVKDTEHGQKFNALFKFLRGSLVY